MQPARESAHGSGQDENIHFAARHLIKMRGRTTEMILFAFHALGNGVQLRFDLAHSVLRSVHVADETIEGAFGPLGIIREHLQRTQVLAPAGKTMRLPVAEWASS